MLNGDWATYLQNSKGRWRQFTIIGLDYKIDDSYNLQKLWGPILSLQGLLISYSPVKNTKICYGTYTEPLMRVCFSTLEYE